MFPSLLLLAVLIPDQAESKIYPVRLLPDAAIVLDGVLDEPAWTQARVESGFAFPWEQRAAPATAFRALCDGKRLCFAFAVTDPEVVVEAEDRGEETLLNEDRVEFYFAPDRAMKRPYFCVEMDFRGRRLDYRAVFHRRFDFTWNFPGLEFAGQRSADGYRVEGAFTLSALAELGLPTLIDGRDLPAGVYRAEFRRDADGKPVEGWMAWVDPKTEEADFHIPATLGLFRLER